MAGRAVPYGSAWCGRALSTFTCTRKLLGPAGSRGASSSGAGEEKGGQKDKGGWRKNAGVVAFSIPIFGTAYLGTWQAERYTWKMKMIEDMHVTLAAEPILPPTDGQWEEVGKRRVRTQGRFDTKNVMLVGPRSPPASSSATQGSLASSSDKNKTGYFVIVPFFLKSGGSILVNRGWIPSGMKGNLDPSDICPAPTKNNKDVMITVVPCSPEKAGSFSPPNEPDKGTWFSIDEKAMSEHAGLGKTGQLCDFIEMDPPQKQKYPIPKKLSDLSNFYVMPITHMAYSVTWYMLSGAMAVGTYIRFFR